MPITIPNDASQQLQKALHEIERRLQALEAPAAVSTAGSRLIKSTEDRLTALETPPPSVGPEWDEMVGDGPLHRRGITPDTYPNAGLGHERVLHADGQWKRSIGGLIQEVPEGVGRPFNATRVVEVLADLAVASAIGANEVNTHILTASPFPSCRLTRSANQAITTGTLTAISFTVGLHNYGNLHSTVTNPSRITFPSVGLWLVGGEVVWESGGGTYRQLLIAPNGSVSVFHGRDYLTSFGTGSLSQLSVTLRRYAVGDYVELLVQHDHGSDLNVTFNDEFSPLFWAVKLL